MLGVRLVWYWWNLIQNSVFLATEVNTIRRKTPTDIRHSERTEILRSRSLWLILHTELWISGLFVACSLNWHHHQELVTIFALNDEPQSADSGLSTLLRHKRIATTFVMAIVDPKRTQTIAKFCCSEQYSSTQKYYHSRQELPLLRWLERRPYCFFLGLLLHTLDGSMEVCILPIRVPLHWCISLLAANGILPVGAHLQLTFCTSCSWTGLVKGRMWVFSEGGRGKRDRW